MIKHLQPHTPQYLHPLAPFTDPTPPKLNTVLYNYAIPSTTDLTTVTGSFYKIITITNQTPTRKKKWIDSFQFQSIHVFLL
jgi:hypothetical protein